MSDISKFLADIQRIKKHVRSNNGGNYDGEKVCRQVADLFASNNRHIKDGARWLSEYWLNTYILTQSDLQNQPDEAAVSKLIAFQYFIDGNTDEDFSCLTHDDWETLKDCADDIAEDVDLTLLQGMMSILLNQGEI